MSPGGWSAAGTVNNWSKEAATYTVTIYFRTPTATILDYGSTEVTADPGQKASWKVEKKFAAQPQMSCALVGVTRS